MVKRIGWGALAALLSLAGTAMAKDSWKVTVNQVAALTCTCSTAHCHGNSSGYSDDWASQFSYRNRRSCDPYGNHYFSWSTNGTATVYDEGNRQVTTGASGKTGRNYGSQGGYIYWSVTCTNDLGETQTCSDYTMLSCFPAGTKITLVDEKGNYYTKNIEDVKTDDTVLAWDPGTQSFVTSKVTQPVKSHSTSLFEFKTADGNDLKITPTHTMYVDGKGFIPSENVKKGDVLIVAPDGHKIEITEVTSIPGEVDVYNLITDDPHDFFAQNILVHNKNDDLPGHKDHGFVKGTLIQTMRGPVPIEDVRVGDVLISVDPKTGAFRANPVRKTGKEHVTQTVRINGMQMGTQQPLFLGKSAKKGK